MARMWKAGGVHVTRWHVRRDTDKNLGSPIYCLVSGETRSKVEYPHRESLRYGVADALVVLRGRESLPHGEGGHGRTEFAQETSAGHAGSEHRSQPHCGE